MSRVDFFQNKGLIIHRVWNITPDEKKDIFEKTSDYPDNSTILFTGYISPDGKHEYILVTGNSRDELIRISDENYMELVEKLEECKKIIFPKKRVTCLEDNLDKYVQVFIGKFATITQILMNGIWSCEQQITIENEFASLTFQRNVSNLRGKKIDAGYINDMTFQKKNTNYTDWFGFQNTSVEKFVIIKMKDSNDDIIIPYDNIISSSQIVH